MAETAILALGGNALIREDQRGTLEEQYANALAMALSVRSLIRKGWNVVIVHGNGPQVGNLAIQHEGSTDLVPALPLFTLGAMTQGQLGSLICLALNEVCKREITGAVSVITHVEVDPGDPALSHPTKPIGPFFDRTEADALTSVRGWTMAEDSGRGYRRVVPSPRPMGPYRGSGHIDAGRPRIHSRGRRGAAASQCRARPTAPTGGWTPSSTRTSPRRGSPIPWAHRPWLW